MSETENKPLKTFQVLYVGVGGEKSAWCIENGGRVNDALGGLKMAVDLEHTTKNSEVSAALGRVHALVIAPGLIREDEISGIIQGSENLGLVVPYIGKEVPSRLLFAYGEDATFVKVSGVHIEPKDAELIAQAVESTLQRLYLRE